MSNPYVFGVDLDGVTGKYTKAMAAVVEEDRGLEPGSLPEPTDWDFANWGFDEGDFIKYHTELVVNRNGFRYMEPMEGASDVLWRLSNAGVWIRIITHRLVLNGQHSIVAFDTIQWLEDMNIPYRDICFLGAKDSVGANSYVDDGPHNIEALRAADKYAIVFDQPYNQHCEGPRVKDWYELETLVLRHKELLEDDARYELGG